MITLNEECLNILNITLRGVQRGQENFNVLKRRKKGSAKVLLNAPDNINNSRQQNDVGRIKKVYVA